MPWYYAGPEAKPVGPISLEELHSRRVGGLITPETYIIEHSGQPNSPGEWRRYREVFPASGSLPPMPPIPPAVPVAAAAHPLFPSAAHAPAPHLPPSHAAPHAFYPIRKTNSWCAWGFGLAIGGFLLSFCVGFLLAVPALVICIVGLIQVQQNREQSGKGLAITGIVLSSVALLIFVALMAYAIPIMIKNHEWTVTEQSSSSSE